MAVDNTKLITIAGLQNFKTRQDAANLLSYIARADISQVGNEIKIVKTRADQENEIAEVSYSVLTSASSISDSQITSVSASKISGVLSIDNIPAAALERIVTVADQTARYALTSSQVQLGDVVHQTDNDALYFVVDESKLNQADGYMAFTASAAASVPWSGVTGKPESFTPSSHTHGNISNDGKIGSTANLPIITGTDGVLQAGSFGNAANTFCEGNDSRLSDARVPVDHASNKVTELTGYAKGASAPASLALATTDSLNGALSKLEWSIDNAVASAGDMSDYQKAQSYSAISSSSDTVVSAIGKLEAAIDNVATDAEIDEEIFGIQPAQQQGE